MRSLPTFARRAAKQLACAGVLTGALLACASPALADTGPVISVTPPSHNFGAHAEGTTDLTLTVTNTGDADLTLDGFGADGAPDSPFATDSNEGSCLDNPVVARDDSCTIIASFMPDENDGRGAKTGYEVIRSDAVNADVNQNTFVPLTGTIIDPPEISVDAPSLDFGNVQAGQSAVQTLTVTNTGEAPLTIRQNLYMGGNDQFSVAQETCSDQPIAHGDQCTIGVRFSPYGGPTSTEMEIHSNATADADEFTKVALSGTGTFTAPAVPTVSSPGDGSTTADSTPDVTVKAEPGVYVHLLVDHDNDQGYQLADEYGNATFTLVQPLADGQHQLVVFAETMIASAERTSTFTVKTTTTTTPPTTTTPTPSIGRLDLVAPKGKAVRVAKTGKLTAKVLCVDGASCPAATFKLTSAKKLAGRKLKLTANATTGTVSFKLKAKQVKALRKLGKRGLKVTVRGPSNALKLTLRV
jgi:HYDIN/CFA65/VesB-like, Ig-like domain/Bacterial Ig-like domain